MEKKKKGKKEWKSKKFNIFGDMWTIVFCEKVLGKSQENEKEHWIWGQTIDAERKILVSTLNEDNKPLSEYDILCTVAHECVHAILDSGQYLNASQDEPMVEFLAKGILSLIKSKVFEYEKV